MIVQYLRTDEQNWLREGACYVVQAIYFDQQQGARYRIISEDASTPALFVASEFLLVDGSLPSSWCIHVHLDGSFVFGPSAWLELGFWTRYFDGDDDAKRIFELHIQPNPMK